MLNIGSMKHVAVIKCSMLAAMACLLFAGPLTLSGRADDEAAGLNDALSQREDAAYEQGVTAYRDGDYRQAERVFSRLHAERPEDSKVSYYLAITQAQQGRFRQARALYQEILTLDPRGEAGRLAQEGLKYLPPDTQALDVPPRFRKQAGQDDPGQTDAGASTVTPLAAAGGEASSPSGMSPQDMAAWQMLMSQFGGNNAGNNPAMPWMMPGAAANGTGNIDPNVMSGLLMNQMMSNFSLEGNRNPDENR